MKQYILKIGEFLGILIVICLLLDVIVSFRLLKSPERKYAIWYSIVSDTTYNDLIINGSSRAWRHYSPSILDSVLAMNTYNLGMDGSAINRQIIRYDKYLKNHRPPKYLVQNIDIAAMDISMGYEREQFYPFFLLDREMINAYDQYEHFGFLRKYVPIYRYTQYGDLAKDLQIYSSNDVDAPKLYKGYAALDASFDGTNLYFLEGIECKINPIVTQKFCAYLDAAYQQGTQVIFVYAPLYYQVYEKSSNLEAMFALYDSIANIHNIPILEYNSDPICRDTSYFYNGTHLNKYGAEIFSAQLANDLLKLIEKDNGIQ